MNPWHLQDTANAIYEALTMAVEERQALHDYAFKYVSEAWIFGKKTCVSEVFLVEMSPAVSAKMSYIFDLLRLDSRITTVSMVIIGQT